MILFLLVYRWGHPKNYLFLLQMMTFVRSKYCNIVWFDFENIIADMGAHKWFCISHCIMYQLGDLDTNMFSVSKFMLIWSKYPKNTDLKQKVIRLVPTDKIMRHIASVESQCFRVVQWIVCDLVHYLFACLKFDICRIKASRKHVI